MIIPIRAPDNNGSISTKKVEWVKLELNGELLKPLDVESSPRSVTSSLPGTVDGSKRRVELGSVKFDADVSIF